MRFVIFDGIQETHVGSSLERALARRGHQVFNTGKIGHGFRFPENRDDATHLEIAVSNALDFAPDVIFVMRPASLPFPLLKRIRKSGATLIAWFSDDPVLFDLTYGPVVTSYDLILHCGNSRVLEFYESKFGYPTGVNFPFWTDHEAFPYSWGLEEPDCDLMFLGNVEGAVRRQRYFELAKLDLRVRVHGRTGIDYLGIQGGYLDSDAQVAAAAASARMALNIPQFFEHHRGIETWFPELGGLGFFEYPSRVVQYMAMGMPTISVVPGRPVFESFPEMIVVDNIVEGEDVAKRLIDSEQLDEISSRTLQHFDANFSADARVLAIESLLESGDWKELDPQQRATWFTQFDGSNKSDIKDRPSEENEVQGSGGNGSIRWSLTPPYAETDESARVLVFGNEIGRFTSRGGAVVSALREVGHHVDTARAGDHMKTLVPDPQRLVKYCLNAVRLGERLDLSSCDFLIVTGIEVGLTRTGADYFQSHGITTIFLDDSDHGSLKALTRLAENYDMVVLSNKARYTMAIQRGFKNVMFAPKFVTPEFIRSLEAVESAKECVHVRRSPEREAEVCPSLAVETELLPKEQTWTYNALLKLDVDQLAETLKAEVALLSYEGTGSHPVVHDLMPYVAVASNMLYVSRSSNSDRIYPYTELGMSVSDIGELKKKVEWLSVSDSVQNVVRSNREEHYQSIFDGPRVASQILEDALNVAFPAAKTGGLLTRGSKMAIEIKDLKPTERRTNSMRLRFAWNPQVGERRDWKLRLSVKGKTHEISLAKNLELRVLGVGDITSLRAEVVYIGPDKEAPMRAAGSPVMQCIREKVEIQGSLGRQVLFESGGTYRDLDAR